MARSSKTAHLALAHHAAARPLRAQQRFGKYRVLKRIASGGFAAVYTAVDTVEGIRVALKVPHHDMLRKDTLQQYRKEARLHAGLDHPNILPVKTAEIIDGRLVVVYPLGKGSLAERMRRRMSIDSFVGYAAQVLAGVAHAHAQRIIHCDIKPENFILFDGDRVRLADFGIAKVAARTVSGSGSGTVGYIAPEQALGKASFRSDVFSLGLMFWRMLTRELPEWPFRWPLPGHDVLRRKVSPAFVAFLRRAVEVDQSRRFADARAMLAAFTKLAPSLRRHVRMDRRRRRRRGSPPEEARTADWRTLRFKLFARAYRKPLGIDRTCRRCDGPLAESMQHCPWCGVRHRPHRDDPTGFPDRCPRCRRGRKLDWPSCAWCHGPRFAEVAEREYPDRRYTARCGHADCRGRLMPFMKYCPTCRRRVARPWPIPGSRARCRSCGWGIVAELWSHCAWCGAGVDNNTR